VSRKLGSEKWNRPIYVAISGLSLLGVMGLWQNTGVLIWVFPEFLGLGLLPFGFHLFSLLYLSILLVALRVLSRLDLGVFAGFTQDARNENQTSGAESSSSTALASGAFSWVRHPIYSLTLLAFFLTPLMSLDRILITVVTLIYLLGWGIPLEEKKLIQEFGESYRKYQKQVPALIPSIQRLKAALSRR
jgi:protein-S-isoprenylcysteine O-methyltransferase Ste14